MLRFLSSSNLKSLLNQLKEEIQLQKQRNIGWRKILDICRSVDIMMRRDEFCAPKIPTLVDLCVQKVIDNVRYLGNVGYVDQHLLERILPHCTVDQLMNVEKSTKGRDLSPVTDKLWKKFFEKQFGTNSTNEVIKKMKEKKVSFKWVQLYEAKGKEMAQAENEALDRIKQLYQKEDAKMNEMSEQRFQSESTDPGRTNISEPEPNMLRVIVVEGNTMDSHYLLDAYYDNRMVYGMTQLNGVQHQPSLDIGVSHHISVTDSSNAIGIPFIHSFGSWGSLIQAPTPNANVSSLENSRMNLQRYHDTTGSRRSHRFAHQHYHHHAQPVQVQEIRGHSNHHHAHYHHHAQPMQVQENRGHSNFRARRGNMHRGHSNFHARRGNMHNHPPRGHSNFHAPRGNMHNLPPRAFLQEVVSFRDHHSDIQLDIDDMSYEDLLILGERIGNVERGLSEEIIARQMVTKTYLLPNNLEGSTSEEEEEEIDLCIICQDEYKNKEEIGILQCGHEYHADCVRRWLQEKNVCPLCKSKALAIG
ncbi:uncharacterized protein [Phaseolus vulgaris]|uniref:uncharacterized protein isoform X4 n=1 Tax=Phaseolus vulgaris TaxID=3885 RepID=UPI0035CBA56E